MCRVLGIKNTANAIRPLAADEVSVYQMNTGGGLPRKTISESGFYKLIGRSDKPVARAFQDWVTREVLPAIEKDGGYIMGEEKVATGEMDDEDVAMSRAITPRLLPVDSL